MSESWQLFEDECVAFLNATYGSIASFVPYGKSDSTVPDVLVRKKNGESFYIEIKSDAAQSGQFVLIPDSVNKSFRYSPRNHTPVFNSTHCIMEYMNDNYQDFVNAGTAGFRIDLPEKLFSDWIVDYYSSKKTSFFITKGEHFIIFPVDAFSKYFTASCCYRMKKSGSANPGKTDLQEIKTLLEANNISGKAYFSDGHLILDTKSPLAGRRLQGSKFTFYFAVNDNGGFTIKKLSNTCNSNVIFSIRLKRTKQDAIDQALFLNRLLS